MKAKERKLARELRKQGYSVREITSKIKCSKSSISKWVQDIPLTDEQIQRLHSNQDRGRAKAAQHFHSPRKKWERIRNTIKDSAKQEIPFTYSLDMLKLAGTALYWGEGYKAGRNRVFFSNSDPAMLQLIMKFFRQVCNVPEEKFRGGVNIHSHLDAEKAKIFWSKISGIPLDQFHKTQTATSKASKGKKDTLPLGTFKITISDTRLLSKIKGWMEGLEKWGG